MLCRSGIHYNATDQSVELAGPSFKGCYLVNLPLPINETFLKCLIELLANTMIASSCKCRKPSVDGSYLQQIG